MLIQSFQNIPFYASTNSELSSELEREVDTKIVAFGREISFTICSFLGLDELHSVSERE